jgi:hypothetical protein
MRQKQACTKGSGWPLLQMHAAHPDVHEGLRLVLFQTACSKARRVPQAALGMTSHVTPTPPDTLGSEAFVADVFPIIRHYLTSAKGKFLQRRFSQQQWPGWAAQELLSMDGHVLLLSALCMGS